MPELEVTLVVDSRDDPHEYGILKWSTKGTEVDLEELAFQCMRFGMNALIERLDRLKADGVRRTAKVRQAELQSFFDTHCGRGYYYRPGKGDRWWKDADPGARKKAP